MSDMTGGSVETRRWPVLVAVVMLASAWLLLRSVSYAEPVVTKRPFSGFPLQLAGRWQGRDLGLEPSRVDRLKLTDYMLRSYVRGTLADEGSARPGLTGGRESLVIYAGFYGSQRSGATYHSPRNCLPGAGWQIMESARVPIPVSGATARINQVLIQKGLERQVILYWYQDRGRVIASEYDAKAYLLWDAMTKNRTDGAMIRISVPVVTSTEAAYTHAMSFVEDVWPELGNFLPPAD